MSSNEKRAGALAKTPRPTADADGAEGVATPRDVALAIAGAALDKKALNVEIIDVRGKVDYADYVVLMSGRSDRQVKAIAQGVERALRSDHGVRSLGSEGLSQGHWALIDFGDVIVHVFHQDMRGYYDLEALWIDAARVEVPDARREDGAAGGLAPWDDPDEYDEPQDGEDAEDADS